MASFYATARSGVNRGVDAVGRRRRTRISGRKAGVAGGDTVGRIATIRATAFGVSMGARAGRKDPSGLARPVGLAVCTKPTPCAVEGRAQPVCVASVKAASVVLEPLGLAGRRPHV